MSQWGMNIYCFIAFKILEWDLPRDGCLQNDNQEPSVGIKSGQGHKK